jgi:ABC-2 type transport system permease protein
MRRALVLYLRLILMQLRIQLVYRFGFLMETLGTVMITLGGFLTIALVLETFDNIGGWSLSDVALLYGIVETCFGVMDLFFSGFDPGHFGRQYVRLGRLDQLFLRPVSITLQVFASEFILRRIGRIAQGATILGYALYHAPGVFDPGRLLFLGVVCLSTVCFFGGLFIFGATITFWTVESIEIINIFTYGGSEMMSYPMHIYQDWLRNFFTYILPAIFLVYYPALWLLGKPDPLNMPAFAPFLSPIVGIGVLLASLVFWQVGLRHYQSTGT